MEVCRHILDTCISGYGTRKILYIVDAFTDKFPDAVPSSVDTTLLFAIVASDYCSFQLIRGGGWQDTISCFGTMECGGRSGKLEVHCLTRPRSLLNLMMGVTRFRALAGLVIANHVVSCSCAVLMSFFTLKRTIAREGIMIYLKLLLKVQV